MITWKNLDTLPAYESLKTLKGKVDLAAVMKGEEGARRTAEYSVPMAAGLTYNYAAKQVDTQVLEALKALAQEAEPQKDGSYWVRYTSANQTKVYIQVDIDGKIDRITIDGSFAERDGEWTKVKDATLNCERLGLDSGIRSEFTGGDCASGTREDYDWGYVMAGNMNTVFIWIDWNEPIPVYDE